jgi:acetyltransferase-like isoleucine patch superfamily enzyme
MRLSERITSDHYSEIDYHQFTRGSGLKLAMTVAGVLCWPVVLPMALLSRISDFVFRTCSELLAVVPYLFGVIVRFEFYRWTLTRCGKNVSIGFGTVFFYRDISIGDNVEIGNFNAVHYCDFGSYLLIADACHFLSGARYHNLDRVDIPMALQGGKLRRITIGDDCWIGAGAIIMDDVATGCVIGAGSVVNASTEPYTIVAGNPARLIRKRE